ncbi:MAG: hypothetical protein M1828_003297 [Chrysothrix sp. TS-e1954]|nr:MAG: hypothetical protein M1828_003297 [Chrysothrix sp. TS-e1954]
MAAPVVPQRPSRSQHPTAPSNPGLNAPQIPPRPTRGSDRSASRDRDASTRSPLNEAPSGMSHSSNRTSGMYQHGHDGASNTHIPRPPSVQALPLIGQEGMEYASLDQLSPERQEVAHSRALAASPDESRVASDLPLHAPKASLPKDTAKARVAGVTRTDSSKAAIVGVGKAQTEYDDQPQRPPSSSHFRPPSAVSTDRPGSQTYMRTGETPEQELGIPEIGMQVPMNPMAGDVQMPTPTPGSGGVSTGVGFFNDGSRPESHHGGRRKSAQGFHMPPGSYGLHGHGAAPHDQLERDWYKRHPEELLKEEHGAYGPAASIERGQSAMSSDDLNKLVKDTSSPGFGRISLPLGNQSMALTLITGTSDNVVGAPTEAMGFMASEEYAARVRAAKQAQSSQYQPHHPSSLHPTRSRGSRPGSQSYAESPLRNTSFPEEVKSYGSSVQAVHDSETDDEKLHMKPPAQRRDKYSGAGYDPPVADLGPRGGNTEELGGWVNERGPGTPILASDEIAKNPGAEFLQPAVSPAQPIPESEYYSLDSDSGMAPLGHTRSKSRSRPGSRTTSRPSSMHGHHGLGLSRFSTHDHHDTGTPLEEIEEYEPLFVDDDDGRKIAVPDKLKHRLDLEKRRFPSQDIWEDTPTSLQLQTTVETPEQSPQIKQMSPSDTNKTSSTFEHPDKEQERKGEVLESERLDFLSDERKGFAKPKFGTHLQEEASHRPGMSQRFPSRDIWEDTPDSLSLHTTVGGTSPPEAQKMPATSSMTQIVSKENDREEASLAGKPAVPDRPTRTKPQSAVATTVQTARQGSGSSDTTSPSDSKVTSPTERRAPSIPDRPKPQVPARPARTSGTARSMEEPSTDLSKQASQTSTGSNDESALASSPPTKTKPTVPSRPHAGSSKIASLKAGFMNDLNSRLQLGPQPSKVPAASAEEKDEPREVEEKPLADARKGRARGPARRKPAVSPDPSTANAAAPGSDVKLSIATPKTTWHIPNDVHAMLHVGIPMAHHSPSTSAPSATVMDSSIAPEAASAAITETSNMPTTSDLSRETHTAEAAAHQQSGKPETLPSPTASSETKSPTSPTDPSEAPIQRVSSKDIGISPTTGEESNVADPIATHTTAEPLSPAQSAGIGGKDVVRVPSVGAAESREEGNGVIEGGVVNEAAHAARE